MKKLFLVSSLIYLAASLSYAAEDNLYETFKGYNTINVFLEEVKVEAKDPAVKEDVFRNVFKEVLGKREAIKFIYSDDKENADVIITVKIKDYIFTENAMPMMFSTATLVADSLSPKSSGRLVVDYEVIGPREGKRLLHYKGFATEERRPKETMKGDSGFLNSAAKNINRFIYKAFYKPKNR